MSRIDPAVSRLRPMPKPPSLDELRKRASARLAERLDPTKTKFKPLSILRLEARRAVEQFLEIEAGHLPKPERDKLADEVLGEGVGLGPLEELFRDESVAEFMTLAHNQIIARKGDNWTPTSVTLRDAAHYRELLAKLAEQGEPLDARSPAGFAVRLPNGWRVLAVLPPAVLDQPPLATFTRGMNPPPAKPEPPASGINKAVTLSPGPGRLSDGPATTRGASIHGSGSVQFAPPRSAGQPTVRMSDPIERLRQRVTERLIAKLAAAGKFDISQVPAGELRRIVGLYAEEMAGVENLELDAATRERLAADIVAGMNR